MVIYIQVLVQYGERQRQFNFEEHDINSLGDHIEQVTHTFNIKSKDIVLRRYEQDWNEYVDVNSLNEILHKDKIKVHIDLPSQGTMKKVL